MSKLSKYIDEQIAQSQKRCTFPACTRATSLRFGGLPICDDHGDAVIALSGSKPPPPKEPEKNRHGIPRRGGNPKRCIFPYCTNAEGVYRGTMMCSEHASGIATLVNRHDRAIQAVREERMRKNLDSPHTQAIIDDVTGQQKRRASKPKREKIGPVVYYIKYGELIKIGSAKDLEARLATYNPGGELLATEPGDRDLEQKRHEQLAIHRIYGKEWYAATPTVLHHIDLLTRKHGEPPEVNVGPRPVTVLQPREPQYVGGKRYTKPGPPIGGKTQ